MIKWYNPSDVASEYKKKMRQDLKERLSQTSTFAQERFSKIFPHGVPDKELESAIALVQRTIDNQAQHQ